MNSVIKKAIKAGVTVPASCLRSLRGYEPLASIRSQPSPRVLIIACHWLGDTLWAAQVVPALRNLWQDGHLACVAKPICAPLWSGDFSVDQCLESAAVISDRRREAIDWSALRRLSDKLNNDTWDLIIDLTGNRYSAILTHWIRARHTLGFDGGEFGALYATSVLDAEHPGRHLSERPFRVIEPLLGEFAYPDAITPPPIKESYGAVCKRYGFKPEAPLALVAPGAGWAEKEWGDNHFSQLARRLGQEGYVVALLDSPARRSRLDRIAQAASGESRKMVIVAEPSIDSGVTLLSGCALFVGNDSGMSHIAAAMGRPTLVIFTGETKPEICGPLGSNVHVMTGGDEDKVFRTITSLRASAAVDACVQINRNIL